MKHKISLFNSKKGELSLQVVVMAVIALLVLTVLVVIFTGRMGVWSWTVKNCESMGGVCKASCDKLSEGTLQGTDCNKRTDGNKICCKQIDIAPE